MNEREILLENLDINDDMPLNGEWFSHKTYMVHICAIPVHVCAIPALYNQAPRCASPNYLGNLAHVVYVLYFTYAEARKLL
jgi:hypothetical protein